MTIVASVDYVEKKIYLHADTVGIELDTMDVYKEVRTLRRLDSQTPYPHRSFKPIIIQGGNIQKTATTFTPKYVQLLYGCRIIPYDADQNLKVVRDTFTDDGKVGRDCFDRTGLINNVDIDYVPPQVEIIEVSSGSGLSQEEHDKLLDLDTNNLDIAVSTRLADVDYIEPDNAVISANNIKLNDIGNDITNLDDDVSVVDSKVTGISTEVNTIKQNTINIEAKIDIIDTLIDNITSTLITIESKIDIIDGIVDNILSQTNDISTINTAVEVIRKIAGNNFTKLGNVITIYEDNGTTIFREYNVINDERILI